MRNLPARNIHKIESLSLGVQNNNNSAPLIGGAVGDPAYFVDGVRVRFRCLALAGFSY
ncbi:MAG: hypothetical protein H7296_04885 [Bacteroidia bacterium]|nr:hypothetical protein [Bacteroidia bacterium]